MPEQFKTQRKFKHSWIDTNSPYDFITEDVLQMYS